MDETIFDAGWSVEKFLRKAVAETAEACSVNFMEVARK
jgi:hypothetical protein